MNATVSVNGRITDASAAAVPVFDHGFLYGEGVYETLRTYGRDPFLFDRHIDRLRRSAELIALPVPFSDADLRQRVDDTMTAHDGAGEVYIRILLTRGVGELTYDPAACPDPTLVVIVKPFPEPAERTFTEGVSVALVGIRRNHPAALNPLIKSNNLLNNALAMQQALRQGASEALMLNQAGELTECSQSNFFLVVDSELRTPPLEAGLLAGITRAYVIDLAREIGIATREAPCSPADLSSASEAFLTSTTREITPVVSVDGRSIGEGRPGPITRRVLREFRARVRGVTA